MPTRVHDAQARKIQPQRQCFEPIRDVLLPRRSFDYVQKRLMLLSIPWLVMIPQELPRMLRVRSHPRDGIEFMIAQNGPSRPRCCHRPNQLDGLHLLRSTVDYIADKDGGTAGMTPHTIDSGIAQMFEERNQFVILAVDVADDVKAHLS